MTTSVRELKRDLIEESVPLSILLRRAILLARELKDEEAEKWISRELNGYQDGDKAPEYRILAGQPMMFNPNWGWQLLLLEGNNRDWARLVTSMPTFGPIRELEHHSKEESVKLHYGHEMEQFIQSHTNLPGKPGLAVSGAQFQTIITTVRNKLLDWVSNLSEEKEDVPIQTENKEAMPTQSTWKESIDKHPLGYASALVVATAFLVGGIMGWIQNERIENLVNRHETEKLIMKNEYEVQVRDLKAQISELQKQIPQPKKGK